MTRRAVVLVSRRSGARVFVPGLEHSLRVALSAHTRRDVYVYAGNESAAQTLAIFANARAVVGYHGAGFGAASHAPHSLRAPPPAGAAELTCRVGSAANTMFSLHGACVVEASANADTAGKTLWRTNAFMCLPWNPLLRWAVYRVPLGQLLDANGKRRGHPASRRMRPTPRAPPPRHTPRPPGEARRQVLPQMPSVWRLDRCAHRAAHHGSYPNGSNWQGSDQFIKALRWVSLRHAEVAAMAAAAQHCLRPLERGEPWPLLELANASQRLGEPGTQPYLDRIDLHTLRRAAAKHAPADHAPAIDDALHWSERRR